MTARLARYALAGLMLFGAGLASAQTTAANYPTRLIRFIVPYPTGGLTDLLARVIAEKLQAAFKQPVIVENKPGVGTLLGAEYVAKSPPDGHTLMIANVTTFIISPQLYPKPPVNPLKDLTPISRIGATNFFVISSPSFPARNLKQLIEHVRRNPGKFNYASVGSGTPHHLYMEVLKKEVGLDIQHVPYKGSAAALMDVMSGKVEMMFIDGSLAVPNVKSGKVIGIGSSMAKQTTLLPSVPPIATTVPGFDWEGWQGVAGPAGMPWPVVTKIADVLRRFQETPEYRELMFKTGMEALPYIPPEKMADFVKNDRGRWATAIKVSGAKVD